MKKQKNIKKVILNSCKWMIVLLLTMPQGLFAEIINQVDTLSPKTDIQLLSFQKTLKGVTKVFSTRLILRTSSSSFNVAHIEQARNDGRLFFLQKKDWLKEIFTLRDGSVQEVSKLFLQTTEKEGSLAQVPHFGYEIKIFRL